MGTIIYVENNALNFGNDELESKTKDVIEISGDVYNIKSFYEITRLEKNDVLLYESVPGTVVKNFVESNDEISFEVFGKVGASIILGVKDGIDYKLYIDGVEQSKLKFISPSKLNINLDFYDEFIKIELRK